MIIKNKTFNSKNFPYIMGILNVTPDSFSDGGKFNNIDSALFQTEKMIAEGADIIDIGGESTRPNYTPISETEEISRIEQIVIAIVKRFPDTPLSIDTYKSKVAEAALSNGCSMVNDIWGLRWSNDNNRNMAKLIAKHDAACVIMHNRKNIVELTNEQMLANITDSFIQSLKIAKDAKISQDKIILDPGIGFGGKSVEQNLECIKNIKCFKKLGYPILIGLSNKSFIGNILDIDVDNRLIGTLTANIIAIQNGAGFIRVHDVKAHKQAIEMLTTLS